MTPPRTQRRPGHRSDAARADDPQASAETARTSTTRRTQDVPSAGRAAVSGCITSRRSHPGSMVYQVHLTGPAMSPPRGGGHDITAPHSQGLVDCRLPLTCASAASGNVRPVHDRAEAFVGSVLVAPDDVAADHAPLLFVAGVVGAVESEVAQGG